MIQTGDTDYAANYDTDYEKPIKSRLVNFRSHHQAFEKTSHDFKNLMETPEGWPYQV